MKTELENASSDSKIFILRAVAASSPSISPTGFVRVSLTGKHVVTCGKQAPTACARAAPLLIVQHRNRPRHIDIVMSHRHRQSTLSHRHRHVTSTSFTVTSTSFTVTSTSSTVTSRSSTITSTLSHSAASRPPMVY